MNRNLKFRVFDKHDNRIKYADLEWFDDMFGFRFGHRGFEEEDDSDVIIMQFTGLHDKNGKEIYEGDILDFGNKNYVPVVFDNGCFNVFDEPLGWDFDSEEIPVKTNFNYCEIVGNIYENPELLSGGEK